MCGGGLAPTATQISSLLASNMWRRGSWIYVPRAPAIVRRWASENGCRRRGVIVTGVRATADTGRGSASAPSRGSHGVLVAVKVAHTLAWFSIESCMIYVLFAGVAKRSDRRAAIAGAVVAGESLVFAANGFRCPLTDVAEQLGPDRGSVTDIYLPRWFAHNLPALHVPLIIAAGYLHTRNLRERFASTGRSHQRPAPDRTAVRAPAVDTDLL